MTNTTTEIPENVRGEEAVAEKYCTTDGLPLNRNNLTEEVKEKIRERYTEYLTAEFGADHTKGKGFGSGSEVSVPFIDRPYEEQERIKQKYAPWGWDDEELERYCIVRPEFSDPDFWGVWVNHEVPITNRAVRKWFDRLRQTFREGAHSEAIDCIDYFESTGRTNNVVESDFNSRHPIAGWLYALALMSEQQMAGQNSHELRVQTEETQFAAEISSALHDCLLEIKNLSNKALELDAAYSAIIIGRRLMDVEYCDEDGTFIHQSAFIDKIQTEANKRFLAEKQEEQERLKQEQLERAAADFDAWKQQRDERIAEWEEQNRLPVGVLLCEYADEEHY